MKWLLLTVSTLALAACQPRWDKQFKADLRTAVELKFTMFGAGDLAAPLARCVVDEAEKRVPRQSDMQAIVDGAPSTVGAEVLKHCACDVVRDPRALATPGYCEVSP